MGVENFYQGEEVSARKLNELVCAINGLCSTMQALQREQTVAGLGQNDRPRMLGRAKEACEEPQSCTELVYDMCFIYDTVEMYVPPWGVIGVSRLEYDPNLCYCVTKRYYYVKGGVWKEGQAYPAGSWCSTTSSDGLSGKWQGPAWGGGWIAEPSQRYLFATNCGKLVLRNSIAYDWRYERLLADLQMWETPRCAPVRYIARNGCTETIFFPVQYWTGDICQPKARWEQGGLFSVRMDPRTGMVHICGGLAMVEGPLAMGGCKWFEYSTQTTHEEKNALVGQGAYVPVPGFNSRIPSAVSGRMQYLYLGYNNENGNFWWFWRRETVSYAKKDIPIFTWTISTTSEVSIDCGKSYVICTTWQTKYCNYDTWKMAVPMGVAYAGECGWVCVATAQYVPQFRARPIFNLQNAATICSQGNDWACEGYKNPCGCTAAWMANETTICQMSGDTNGIYLDVLREVYVKWTPVYIE